MGFYLHVVVSKRTFTSAYRKYVETTKEYCIESQRGLSKQVLSEISGSGGGEYEDGSLLGCWTVLSGSLPTFQRRLLPVLLGR
jgi:hypothetical protein